MNALFFGSWISQGVVRGAVGEGNCGGGGVQNEVSPSAEHHGVGWHCNCCGRAHWARRCRNGAQVLHTNIECALKQLKLRYDAWNYKSPTPQSTR